MHSWSTPEIPTVSGTPVPLALYDTADQIVKPVETHDGQAGMYVCGITPYDATHLGHAATYLAFDLIGRQLRDNKIDVTFVENVTDVDDPLFERADRDGVDWRELGESQTHLFRSDMEALKVIPPTCFVAVTTIVDEVIELVKSLLDHGGAYIVDDDRYPDIYAPVSATDHFGYVSHLSEKEMLPIFASRGGDPDRAKKHNKLDALIWRAAREGEPCWDAPFGAGRPGWHVECAAIAKNRLGCHFAIQGGGADLTFPHHEFTAAHVEAASGTTRMAGHFVHTGMIALDGVKMSKSLGNLVFVHKLLDAGHDPSAIRLAVIAGHYRSNRNFSDTLMQSAEEQLTRWRSAKKLACSVSAAEELVQTVREHLAKDLDTPGALRAIDRWALGILEEGEPSPVANPAGTAAGEIVAVALDALLGVTL